MHVGNYGYGPQGYGPPPMYRALPGQPLGGLARIAQAALVLVIASDALVIWAVLHQRSVVQSVIDHDGSVSLTDVQVADHRVTILSRWSIAAFALTAILFAVWFWRVRKNAGGYDPSAQRRSQPWAFWGWVCPVVSLWFPLQIAIDAVTSTPGDRRGAMRLLGFWWALYLLAFVLARGSAGGNPKTLDAFQSHENLEIVVEVVEIVAAALAIATVALITRRLDAHRAQLLSMPG